MTYYREITPLQEPSDEMGLDDENRVQIVFNVALFKRYSATVEEELVKVLTAASVGVSGTNIFSSSKAVIPITSDDTAILSVRVTGGFAPERRQNVVSPPAYPRPNAQILVRSVSYVAARTMARAAYLALAAVRNVDITP